MKIILSNRKAKLVDPLLPAYVTLLKEQFFYERPYQETRWNKYIPKHVYMVDDDGVFWNGLLKDVCLFFDSINVKYEIEDVRTEVDTSYIKTAKIKMDETPFEPRDYQIDAIRQGLKFFNGLFYIATGGGKTMILSTLAHIIDKKTLVVVDSIDLANQLKDDIKEFTGRPESDFNVISSFNSKSLDDDLVKAVCSKINICVSTSLVNPRFGERKQKAMRTILEWAEYLIIDEAHKMQGTTMQTIAEGAINARLFHAYTATPITSTFKGEKKNTKRDILFKAIFERVLFRMTTEDLIERGWLAKPSVNFVKNSIDYDGDEILEYVDEFDTYIVNNEERNRLICSIFKKYHDAGQQCIGFVTKLEHGDLLSQMLQEEFGIEDEDMAFVCGEDDPEYRTEMISAFKNKEIKILFGTILNEGLNFFCDAGINCSAGSSEKLVIQRLGRILRKERSASGDVDVNKPEFVDFYDFCDYKHPIFRNQSWKRRGLLNGEGHSITYKEVEELNAEN